MSKPPAPRAGDEGRVPEKVVEIDAIDVAEWERDQHTPQAPVAGLAALVRQTAPQPAKPRSATQQMPVVTAKPPKAQGSQTMPPQAQAPAAKAPPSEAPPKQAPAKEALQSQPHPPLGPKCG